MTARRESDRVIEILVVEDSRTQAEQIAQSLKGAGYHVRRAVNGAEGLVAIRAHPPHLVISDIVMPVMDGYAMCRAIKDEPGTKGIPVIILTSLSDTQDVMLGIEAGVDYYLTKPFQEEALLSRIEDVLDSFSSGNPDDSEKSFMLPIGGVNRVVWSTRQRLVTLLSSTYESAVRHNTQLQEAQGELEALNHRQQVLVGRLKEAKNVAEDANHAQSDFLGSMSHELRTFLNSIIGFTEVLQDEIFGALAEKQREYLGFVEKSSRHLLSLINDILDISKIEAGKMEIEYGPVGVRGLVEGALVMVREKALAHSIALTVLVSSSADITIQADERKFKQMLYNLLSNAVKFTPDGGKIAVSAERSGAVIELCVEDSGIGVSAEQMATLFTRFGQLEGAYEKKYEGTGLGLSLVKELALLHGGSARAESEPGIGSRFYVTLPVDRSGENTGVGGKND
jgi:two-component system sensor histidine kinase/response regulator